MMEKPRGAEPSALEEVRWEPVGAPRDLGRGEVHLYRIPERPGTASGAELLAPEEAARAARFRFARDREAFVARRVGLRRLLSRYGELGPGSLALAVDARGKLSAPLLPELSFNLSGTRGLALAAVTRGGPIGVDVEALRGMPDALDIARSFFSADEVDALAGLAPAPRARAFLVAWTRKEAYLKGLGVGLSGDLRAPPAPPWRVRSFAPGDGFVASLATSGAPVVVRFFDADPQ